MSEPKFTKGPWRVGAWSGRCLKPSHRGISHPGPRGDDPCVYTPEFVEGLHGIATDDGRHVVSISYDEMVMTEADARLIAAAPDLFEALQTMLQQFTKTPSSLADSAARANAHRALKKALGDPQ